MSPHICYKTNEHKSPDPQTVPNEPQRYSKDIEVRKKYGRFYTFTYHDPNVTAPATLSIQANDDADIKPW